MPKILISYRRVDSDAITGRIRDRLSQYYGEGSVFMDIDSIPLGIDFRKQIHDAILENQLLIAIIGPKWLGPGDDGTLRINDELDPVRIELETALERGIPTIPVLVGGATMPRPNQLPEKLKDFSYYNAAVIDAGIDFRQHVDRLIRSIDMILKRQARLSSEEGNRGSRHMGLWAGLAAGIVALVAAGGVGWYYFKASSRQMPQVAAPSPQAALAPPAASQPQVQAQAPAVSTQPANAPTSAPAATPPAPTSAPAATPPVPTPVQRFASATEAATACEANSAPLLYQDLKSDSSGWQGVYKDDKGAGAAFVNGALVITAQANDDWIVVRNSDVFFDASICARVQSPPEQTKLNDGGGGITFWATDTDNYYAVYITPAGTYGILRYIKGDETTVVSEVPSAALKQGPNAVNAIRLTANGETITVAFNGIEARGFHAERPKGGIYSGLTAASEETQRNEWRFLDLTIVAPNYGQELTDYGVGPQTRLQEDVGRPTPMTLPGARVLRTGELGNALSGNSLDGSPFVLLDVLAGTHQTINGAHRLQYAGSGDDFNDDIEKRLARDLKALAKNNMAMPLVFFCEGSKCWESYNAALRALKIGFTHVYWYRGGLTAWQEAGLPVI
jgi:PQQ-dependent catabolism-associated CXXCW motif protein